MNGALLFANAAAAALVAWLWASSAEPARTCEGREIVFLVAGTEQNDFSRAVHQGVEAARGDLGCAVKVRWTQWDPARTVNQLETAVMAEPDGICLPGHPIQPAYADLLDAAFARGIIVTSYNGPLSPVGEAHRQAGLGYVGQHVYDAGRRLGAAAVEKYRPAAGSTALVLGVHGIPDRGERTRGVVDALDAAGLRVLVHDMYTEYHKTPPRDISVVLPEYIASHPEIALIVSDAGPIEWVAKTLETLGVPHGQIKLAGFDLREGDIEQILDGYGGLLLPQQPWLQGYLPVVQICLTGRYGISGLHIDTSAPLVDETNARQYLERVGKGMQ